MATAKTVRDIDGGHKLELKNVVVSTVKPWERTAHAEKYDVALFDVYLADFYMTIMMLFRPDGEDQNRLSGSEFVSRMKESLSRILVPYYPFAGRFRKTYDIRLRELLCNDEGVPFIEAEIDEELEKSVNVDDFQPMSILSGYEFLGLDPVSFYQLNDDFPLPACFIQATKFKCGGISLNVNFLHMVGDGHAMFQFLQDWSRMTLDDQSSFERIHDRSLTYPLSILLDMMAAPSTATETQNPEEQRENAQTRKKGHDALPLDDEVHDQMNKLNASLQNNFLTGSAPPVTTKNSAVDRDEQMKSRTNGSDAADSKPVDMAEALRFPLISEWTRKTLHVRRERVQNLKEKAKDRNEGFVPTALDCIQSLLWRGLSRIPSSIDGRKSTIYGVVAEGRKRLHDPPIPDSYSGNDFVLLYSQPLEQPSYDPLVEAEIVHQMVQSVSPQSWLSHFARAVSVLKNCTTADERSFFLTSWYRFPMYDADFGYGKPILATCNLSNSAPPAGFAVLMPPHPGSNHLATLQLVMAPEMLEAMLNDPEFRSLFH